MIDLLQTIADLQRQKEENRIVPTHVSFIDLKNEVIKQVRDELNELCKEGKIRVTKTLNDKAICINDGYKRFTTH